MTETLPVQVPVNTRELLGRWVKVKARVRDGHTPSWDACRSVMAKADTLRAQQVVDIRGRAEQDARAKLESQIRREVETEVQRRYQLELDKLRGIEAALGCSFTEWRGANGVSVEQFVAALRIAKAHREVAGRWGGISDVLRGVDQLRPRLAELADALNLDQLDKTGTDG